MAELYEFVINQRSK